jgi:DNA-binding response OmpR family regulator
MPCDRVLLLHCDDRVREALQSSLELRGVWCCSAGTLERARCLLESGCVPSLVVLDVSDPPRRCLELFRSVRAEAVPAHVPVLVTTSVPVDALGSVAHEATHVIVKPFELAAFVACVVALVAADPDATTCPGPPALP